ncbi:MAG: haloacid dehalogenase-like hydrolase, partial [Candidatus Thiodiazotropha sp.]
MTLAIFDLDNTLLAGDSDYLWGEFLVERGIVDGKAYKLENDRFY